MVGAFVQKIQHAYEQARYLGFNIGYYYSNADKPNSILDSLSGQVQMDKGRSRLMMQGTETVVNDKYSIQVNEDEKTIYLAAAHRANTGNPWRCSTASSHIWAVSGCSSERKASRT
ncbi:hypothetical protein ACQ86N_41185 [Puia sp. P3]|uniref:hypothetical protein n=1 Tax=Puia sp. P3 TaxID=3423952 RepID=UPI003D66FA28